MPVPSKEVFGELSEETMKTIVRKKVREQSDRSLYPIREDGMCEIIKRAINQNGKRIEKLLKNFSKKLKKVLAFSVQLC